MNSVGLTSRWVAASRAAESMMPNRLFNDPYAQALAGPEGVELLNQFMQGRPGAKPQGPDPYFSIRTRFFDDEILKTVKGSGLRQVVIFAAGMDSRAFRLDWPDGVTFFEVDQPEVLDYKEDVLQQQGAQSRGSRKVVHANLEEEWMGQLVAAGFDPKVPAAFLVEGLLVYLQAKDVDRFLSNIGGVAAPGSWLGADFPNLEFLSSPYMAPLVTAMELFGSPWLFGVSEPEAFFAERGWAAKAVAAGEWEANFGRWPYGVVPREIPGVPRTFLVSAQRTG